MQKLRISKINEYILILMLISIFLIPFYVRKNILGFIADMNIIFMIALALYLLINREKINIFMFTNLILLCIYIFAIDYIGNYNSIKTIIRNISMVIIPIFLLTIKPKILNKDETLDKIIKIFNFFIIIVFIIGFIDPFIDFSIMKFIGNYITPELNIWIQGNAKLVGYRYTSYMGHALFTKELFLYFYLLNNIYYKKNTKYLLNKNIVTIISLIGILLTGSKVGTLLIIISIIVTEISNKKIRNILIAVAILIFSYNAGFFNNIILRLQNETLTTGRNESWKIVKELNIIELKFLSGYGEYISEIIKRFVSADIATAALEYPIRILMYKYGIVCTFIITAYIFIYPIINIINKKENYILFAFTIKLLDIFSYNGLIYKPDNMILFIFFIYIIMFLFIKEKNCENENIKINTIKE